MITAHVPPFNTLRRSTLEEAYEMYNPPKEETIMDTPVYSKINPEHYNNTGIEPIDVIEDWNLGFHLGNCIKYIKRAGQKGTESFEDDISKAIWYLQRSIKK